MSVMQKMLSDGVRHSVADKIDRLVDVLDPEVWAIIEQALLAEQVLDADWVEEAEGFHEEAVEATVVAMHEFSEKHLPAAGKETLNAFNTLIASVRDLQWKGPEL